MSKLNTMEKLVLTILENNIIAREDDYVLMYLVIQELRPNLSNMALSDVLIQHNGLGLPKWESVTRYRRKIQEKRPDLRSPEKAKRRLLFKEV